MQSFCEWKTEDKLKMFEAVFDYEHESQGDHIRSLRFKLPKFTFQILLQTIGNIRRRFSIYHQYGTPFICHNKNQLIDEFKKAYIIEKKNKHWKQDEETILRDNITDFNIISQYEYNERFKDLLPGRDLDAINRKIRKLKEYQLKNRQWTNQEIKQLKLAYQTYGADKWSYISRRILIGKTATDCITKYQELQQKESKKDQIKQQLSVAVNRILANIDEKYLALDIECFNKLQNLVVKFEGSIQILLESMSHANLSDTKLQTAHQQNRKCALKTEQPEKDSQEDFQIDLD